MSEIALLLGFFLCENVALVSVFSLDLSCSGHLESLLSAGVGFHLWHDFYYLNSKLISSSEAAPGEGTSCFPPALAAALPFRIVPATGQT